MARVQRFTLDPVTGQEFLLVDGVPTAAIAAAAGSIATRRDAVTGAAMYVRLAAGTWELLAGGGGGSGLTGTLTAGTVPYATGATSLADSILTIVSGRVHAAGELRSVGAAAALTVYDQSTGAANAWATYVTSNVFRVFSFSTASDRMTVSTGGVVTATSFAGSGASLTGIVTSLGGSTGVITLAATLGITSNILGINSVPWAVITGAPTIPAAVSIDGTTGAFTLGSGLIRTSLSLSVGNLPWGAITAGIPDFARRDVGNTFAAANTFSATNTFNGTVVANSTSTVNGQLIAQQGAESVQIKASASDHTYLAFYARTASPSTRTGYIGVAAAAAEDMTIANETTNGWINLRAKGTLAAQVADTGVLCNTFRKAAGTMLVSGVNATYTGIGDGGGTEVMTLGNATDPGNYHNNTTHYFRNRAAGTIFAQINASLMNINVQATVTRNSATEITLANFVNTQAGVTGLYVNATGVSGTSGVVKLYASGDTAKDFQLLTGNDVQIQLFAGRTPARFYNAQGRLSLQSDTAGLAGVWCSNDESTLFMGAKASGELGFYVSGAWRFFVSSSLTTSTTNITAPDFVLSSDRRLKANLAPLRDALARVLQIQGLTYTMRGRKEVGVIAQDVMCVLPEAVTQDKQTGYLGVSYDRLVPLLIEALREAEARIRALERRVA